MKKKILAAMLATAMVFTATACGSSDSSDSEETSTEKETDTETEETSDVDYSYDPFDYVTMGDYKGLEITLDGDYEYTDDGYADYLSSTISDANIYVKDDSQTEVKEDSYVNVDYVGSQDGEAFSGGTATDVTLGIEYNGDVVNQQTYIDGFCDGLVGYSVGEEVASEVTFPENYGSTDLAGQTVTFTFTINYIAKAVTSVDDLTDDIVADNFDYDTVEAFKEGAKADYEDQLADSLEADTETAVLNLLNNNFSVSGVPENILQVMMDITINNMETYYGLEDQTLEEAYEEAGMDYDSMYSEMKESMTESLTSQLILQAIAETEGIEIDEDEFETYVKDSTGADDLQTVYDYYTLDGFSGETYIRNTYLAQQALNFCVENAVVNY